MKAMLACVEIPDLQTDIKYPVLLSPKLDGIRCLAIEGVAYSRNGKLIPNKYVQQVFSELNLHGLDGELMIDGDFNSVQSAIMSTHGTPDFIYRVFDSFEQPKASFKVRTTQARSRVYNLSHPRIDYVTHHQMDNADDAEKFLEASISLGYEGAIIRDPNGPYKYGRSTMKQGWMLKLKKFHDDEAIVVGFKELMHNLDTSCRKQENMVGGDTLGAFIVKWRDKTFDIGSGFDQAQRKLIWENQENYLDRQVTFRYQELSKYGIPRFPTFKSVRLPE